MAAAWQRRILLVEDDDDVRTSLESELRETGYDVIGAADGEAAWQELLRGARPSLIVLDLRVPKVSGWELLDRLRRSNIFIDLPVVIVSAYLGFPPAGAMAWVRKPMRPRQLSEVVERLLPRAV
jgi:CheY-like chemotaxis protein